MLIVIDTDVLCSTFDEQNSNHNKFKPVFKQIRRNKARMVYGGSKYKKELARLRKITRLVSELRKAGRARELCCSKVDEEEKNVKRNVTRRSFNDHHIIAIVIVGRCNFICSCDKRAHPFFKDKNLYPSNMSVPRIYSGLSSARRWNW